MDNGLIKIFLDEDVAVSEPLSKHAHWCEINKKWWFRSVHLEEFGAVLTPRLVFFPPFVLAKAEAVCMECLKPSPAIAVLAESFAPANGEGDQVAEAIQSFLENGTSSRMTNIYLAYVRDYPQEFLREIRQYNFSFRSYNFGDDDTYFANVCFHCKAPVTDHSLFFEPDGSFSRCNPYYERTLTPLKYDLPLVLNAKFA